MFWLNGLRRRVYSACSSQFVRRDITACNATPHRLFNQTAAAHDSATPESKIIRSLSAFIRREAGSRSSRKLRGEGMIPGVIFGGDPQLGLTGKHTPRVFIQTPWKYLQRELDLFHKTFESRVYRISVFEDEEDGEIVTQQLVVPQNVQRHPVKQSIFCANFVRYHSGRPLNIPLRFVNKDESYALRKDGFVLPVQRFVQCLVCDVSSIPEYIAVDCSGLEIKQVIRQDRLILPGNVELGHKHLANDNFILGVVFGSNRASSEELQESRQDT